MRDGIEPPRAGNALELVFAALLELDPGAGDEILYRRRHEHLAGAVEGGQEAVACGLDLVPAKAVELPSDGVVVLFQEPAPAQVTQLGRPFGRADDVREE